MMGLPLAFAAPAVLGALVVLPVIWWLLRLTPPRPRSEEFPPTRLLLEIAKKEETPARSPWWLTLLRLVLAALLIVALAGPIFRPVAEEAPGDGPLLLIVDNGWASAPRWEGTVEAARRIIGIAESTDRPVAVVASADGNTQPLEAVDPSAALARLEALVPQPHPSDRAAVTPALGAIADQVGFGGVAWLTEGLGGDDAAAFADFLNTRIAAPVVVYEDAGGELTALTPPLAGTAALTVPVIRRQSAEPAAGLVTARDIQGRIVGEAPFEFAAGATAAEAAFADLPTELRNDITRVEVSGEATAGAVQLLDERWRRRTVGLLSGATADSAQPLLSPLYYITRALSPYADLREARDPNVTIAVPEYIESGVSVIIMADIGTLPAETERALSDWIERGGTLVRFAGPRLAAASDELVPVELRQGDRTLGGTLSWETPQPLAAFTEAGPFAGLPVPPDVTVERQVLAEPTAELADHVWATLTDGTPLVTGTASGAGRIILFHVTADPKWSNLPISGVFVDMLRRIVSTAQAVQASGEADGEAAVLPPFRLLDGYGRFTPPGASAQPIAASLTDVAVDARHPPGLYGSEDGFRALNLLAEDAALPPFDASLVAGAAVRAYPTSAPLNLAPPLLALALGLLLLDALAVLWLGGAFRMRRRAAATAAALAGALLLSALPGGRAEAQDAADLRAMESTSKTVVAYVITGNPDIDNTSRAGLSGLGRYLADRTALEPGEPVGVDPSADELAFYPLLYWPVDAAAPMPTTATIGRIDAFMKNGGTVLFDTRDQLQMSTRGPGFGGTPAADRLREMLSTLDLPPLEPVPADHVLTKAFYLLSEFPGRYAGGQLWVEALPDASEAAEERPARAGDGVSPILITSNDFAAAWAMDDNNYYMFPTVPNSDEQREYAFRTGINIMMYTLTGNYKADQVHVPALLERLGQ